MRIRRTRCHSRRATVPLTATPGTPRPSGRTAITSTRTGVPAVRNHPFTCGFAPM
ncbi:MAG TPA: hypothetical protein VFJ82_03105 [Longimicrobium sp.]|nr:hypothetical protein [Longimicrobium sp.]